MSSKLDKVCEAIRQSISQLTVEWVRHVKSDPYLSSDDRLTTAQIIDHIPEMLEELCDVMSNEESFDFKSMRASKKHGFLRSAQGYSLTELLRELELLRSCIFEFVAETASKQNMNVKDTFSAVRLMNDYFAEDVIFVVEHFLSKESNQTEN